MSTLTIRNVTDIVHDRLRQRAATNGRSVEAEVRNILEDATEAPQQNILLTLQEMVGDVGADLTPYLPARDELPREVDFG